MARFRDLAKGALALLTIIVGGVAAPASSPVTDKWVADPEEQYLLDVSLHSNRIGEAVRAYPTPEGNCIVLGDFLTTLDVPMKIDMEAQRASGWAFKEENRIEIDRAAGTASINGNREALATTAIREVPEGWCVDAEALSRWFGLGVTANMGGAMLLVESDAKLPIELAIDRRKRAERLTRAKFDLSSLPEVKLPYRMWRTPALDFVVSAGVTYNAHSGTQVDRTATVYASGEVAKMSYTSSFSTRTDGGEGLLRFRAYRSDPDGGLLGPLKATHLELGDLVHGSNGISSRIGGGRGALVTNRPLSRLAEFDRVSFEGDLPAGWDAELYRNGELLAFSSGDGSGLYRFNDIQLNYGDNDVEIVLYGPQGQVRRRVETVSVGDQAIPPGQTWYFASVSQPGRDLLRIGGQETRPLVKAQATIAVDHGIDQKMSIGLLAQTLLLSDERVSYVEANVRRTVGRAQIEATAALTNKGGQRYGLRGIARFGDVSIAASSRFNNNFILDRDIDRVRDEHQLSASIPVKIGARSLPLSARVGLTNFQDGGRLWEAGGRVSMATGRFNLSTELDWQRRTFGGFSAAPPDDRLVGRFIGTGRVGKVRLQGDVDMDFSGRGLTRAGLNAYWSKSDRVDWDLGIAYERQADRFRARVAHVRRLDIASIALTAEAASDGSVAAGLNVAFSLDAPGGSFRPTATALARTGSVQARIFRDDNDNGIRDPGEPLMKGAMITAGHHASKGSSDERGVVTMAGLQTHSPVAIGIDGTTLSDPNLVPRQALQLVVPRPGVTATMDIALVGSGEIEGMIALPDGGSVEGIELELLDKRGRVIASTRSEYDGYFLFEKVAYGSYGLRVSDQSAGALGVQARIDRTVMVGPDRPVMRIGTISLKSIATVYAANDNRGGGGSSTTTSLVAPHSQ